jgi:hypothetical protein
MFIFGYIDPGTGSMILQGIIAGAAGLAALLRFRWASIKGFFSRSSDEEPSVIE